MANVSGGSGGASGSDSISRLKDQFQTRERDSDEKHRDELGQLRRANRSEIEKINELNSKHIEEIRQDNQVKLNQKDVQFQKEIDAVRAMYGRRLAEAKQDAQE